MIPTYLRRERWAIAPELEQGSPTSGKHIRLFIDHLVTPESMQKWLERRHQDCASDEIVPATSLISEKSDRMLVMPEGSYGYMVNGEQKVVEFDYTFSDNAPPAEMPAHGHIFDTESLSVIPRSKTPESLERKLKHRGPGLHSALSGWPCCVHPLMQPEERLKSARM